MTCSAALETLRKKVGDKVQIKINHNRSTMLSVKWQPIETKVSMHRFFLEAPESILDHLAAYIRRDCKRLAGPVKAFIENNIQSLDSKKCSVPQNLTVAGSVYDLEEIYKTVNQEYFNAGLNLSITWFGSSSVLNRTKATFGLYYEGQKLIKIHRMLDSTKFPKEVVSFVVYHEMLHHLYRPEVDCETGRRKVHTKAFCLKEKEFKEYEFVISWLKQHHHSFFRKKSLFF